jgi:O-antigen ligase
MPLDTPSATQLSQVAVAAFVSVLIGRLNRIVDRLQALNAIKDDDTSRAQQKTEAPHLERRAVLLNKAIVFSTISAIVTSLLVIVAFICAFLQLRHEYGVAILFVVALGFFTLSLVDLVREARISLHDIGHYK